MVQDLPQDHRLKVSKVIASKCVLAARVDLTKVGVASGSLVVFLTAPFSLIFWHYPDGSYGEKVLEEVHEKIGKLLEPPPVKNEKPLPKPLEKSSKKRGGRRFRAMKEQYGTTEMRKRANRLTFGELQEDLVQESMGYTLGQAAGGGGYLRQAVADQRTKVRMSKKLQKEMGRRQHSGLEGAATSIVGKAVDGAVSSITFGKKDEVEIIRKAFSKDKELESGTRTYFGR